MKKCLQCDVEFVITIDDVVGRVEICPICNKVVYTYKITGEKLVMKGEEYNESI